MLVLAFIILFAFLAVFYYLCLGSIEIFLALLSKVGLSLSSRALCSFLEKFGCPGGLALGIVSLLRVFFGSESALINWMNSSWEDSWDCVPTSSDWSTFRQFINETPETADSAGTPGQPTEVMEDPAPMWLKTHISQVFFRIKGRKPRKDVLLRLFEDLRLETASPQKRRQIVIILDQMLSDGNMKNSRLDIELAVRIADWAREQP